MRRIIWWVRRDLRIEDNLVLFRALQDGAAVIPVFVMDPRLIESESLAPARKQFLFESLAELDRGLKKRGSYLIVRKGEPAKQLVNLARETQADAVYFHKDYTPYACKRDARVMDALDTAGIARASFNDLYLADPEQIHKEDGGAYTVYTAYRRRFEFVVALPGHYATAKKLETPPGIEPLEMNSLIGERNPHFAPGGEAVGLKLAQDFMTRKNGLGAYGHTRNDMAADATSHLSPHLHFGTVSVRDLARMARRQFPAEERRGKRTAGKARDAGENAKIWMDELVWREFFNQVLYHLPQAAYSSFRPEYADLAWENDAELLRAWQEGRTGYPIVDAGMRQLKETGWMHNRTRMITASFLTKDLLVNWQLGEKYFMQHLIDGDMASNNGGWQWAAGTGTDAQPYFRIFNPVLQSARFDPAGDYIRRWVPELRRIPAQYIHAPWQMPGDMASQIGFRLATDYPKPIVDHAVQRERALGLYRRKTARPDRETGRDK